MRDIVLFSAMTTDGFIAETDGSLEWLYNFDKTNKEATKIFLEFYSTIDTTFIGRKTYDQIIINGESEPYNDKNNYIFTRNNHQNYKNVNAISKDIEQFILQKKNESGKDIWLVGGGELNSYFLEHNYINKIILDVIPVVLGKGIKLFNSGRCYRKMKFVQNRVFQSGRMQIQYTIEQ